METQLLYAAIDLKNTYTEGHKVDLIIIKMGGHTCWAHPGNARIPRRGADGPWMATNNRLKCTNGGLQKINQPALLLYQASLHKEIYFSKLHCLLAEVFGRASDGHRKSDSSGKVFLSKRYMLGMV